MQVRILGGGVAGLSLAIALRERSGIDDVVVYERASDARPPSRLGHGLMLMQNGVEALAALGCTSVLKSCTPLHTAIFRDPTGLTVSTDRLQDVYSMTRAALIQHMRALLPDGVVRYGHDCERVLVSGDGQVRAVHFAHGPTLRGDEADLWVGAEGWRSPMCRALNPGLERTTSRVFEVVTSSHMPQLAAQLGGHFIKTQFPDRGVAFGLLAPSPERVIGFLQFDSESYGSPAPGATPNELRAFITEVLGEAPEPIPTYLRHADMESAHLWRPINADLPPRLHASNAVLIGDAAHPMLPFSSQGVSAALESAVLLADGLHRQKRHCLSAYIEQRRDALQVYIDGGRRILHGFVDRGSPLARPYLDGATSTLEAHMGLAKGSLLQLFTILDTNGNGKLHRREFTAFASLIDAAVLGGNIDSLFDELDQNRDGVIELDELVVALGGEQTPSSPRLRYIRAALSEHRVDRFGQQQRVARTLSLLQHTAGRPIDVHALSAALASEGILLDPRNIDETELLADAETLVARICKLITPRASASSAGDPLFADQRVDMDLLRQRAFNFRWATLPEDVIALTAADSDFPVATEIQQALTDYISGGYLSYGPAAGLPDFRETCAERMRTRQGIPCSAAQILATNSAASALYLAVRCALEPGQEAIIADPVDFLLARSVAAAGGSLRRMPVRIDDDDLDLDAVESLITPGRTRLLSICNPHNPLGKVWSRKRLEGLAEIALRHDLWLISDEVWGDIVYPPHTLTSLASLGPDVAARTFTVTGFSKNYALAGLRLGLLVCPSEVQHQRAVSLSHADETAYGVSTLSQVAGMAAYQRCDGWLERFVAHLNGQRDYALARLRAMPGVRCHEPQGTFVLFPDLSSYGKTSAELVDYLRTEHRVALVPGSPRFFGPGASGHLRISYATSRGILAEGLDRLEAGLAALRARG